MGDIEGGYGGIGMGRGVYCVFLIGVEVKGDGCVMLVLFVFGIKVVFVSYCWVRMMKVLKLF